MSGFSQLSLSNEDEELANSASSIWKLLSRVGSGCRSPARGEGEGRGDGRGDGDIDIRELRELAGECMMRGLNFYKCDDNNNLDLDDKKYN